MGVLVKVRHYPPVGKAPVGAVRVWQSIGTLSGAQALVGASAIATWVVPAGTFVASGAGALSGSPAIATWVVPAGLFVGGVQGIPATAPAWIFLYGYGRSQSMGLPLINKAFAITKSDTVNFPFQDGTGNPLPCSTIYVGGAGDVVVVFQDGSKCTYVCPAGTTLFVSAIRVDNTNTTATSMIANYMI